MLPFLPSPVWDLRSLQYASWYPVLTAFSLPFGKHCPLPVSSSFKEKFSQSRNSPGGNLYCSSLLFLWQPHVVKYTSQALLLSLTATQFTTGYFPPKAPLALSCHLSPLRHSPSPSPYSVCPLAYLHSTKPKLWTNFKVFGRGVM